MLLFLLGISRLGYKGLHFLGTAALFLNTYSVQAQYFSQGASAWRIINIEENEVEIVVLNPNPHIEGSTWILEADLRSVMRRDSFESLVEYRKTMVPGKYIFKGSYGEFLLSGTYKKMALNYGDIPILVSHGAKADTLTGFNVLSLTVNQPLYWTGLVHLYEKLPPDEVITPLKASNSLYSGSNTASQIDIFYRSEEEMEKAYGFIFYLFSIPVGRIENLQVEGLK